MEKITNINNLILKNKKELLFVKLDDYFYKNNLIDNLANFLNNGINFIIVKIEIKNNCIALNVLNKIRQLCSHFNALLCIKSRFDIVKIGEFNSILLTINDFNKKIIEKHLCKEMIYGYFLNNKLDDNNSFDFFVSDKNTSVECKNIYFLNKIIDNNFKLYKKEEK